MKSIQITFDEELLAALDATEEVKKHGRSEIMRRAVAFYLRKRRDREIAESYRKAYEADGAALERFEGWEDESEWPDV